MSAAPDLVLIEKARRESLDATQRRIDAAAKPFAAALAAWLRRFAAVEAARALRDPRAYAGARIDVAKARTPTEPELRGELERLLRMFGLRAAGDAANRTAGEVVIPASLYRDAVASKDVRIQWFWQLEREMVRKVDDILESTRQAARDSVKRILVDASREKVQPSTGEIARRIRTAFRGPGETERPHRVHATEGERAFAFSSERAALIARTETVQAENTGIFGGYVATGVEEVEWLAFVDGRSGDRHHERMKGERVRVGEYFTLPSGAKLRYPGDPMGPIGETVNCFPGETRVMARGVRRIFRRWYSGDLVEIRTTLGHHLTGTPNHPVLTPEGWIALGALDEGGHVFSGGRLDPLLGAHRDDDDAPPTLEQVFRLSSGGDRALHVGSPLDFHGDGQGHEVDVVSVDGELRDRLDAALAKHRSKLGLADADAAQRDLLLSGSLDHLGSGAALPANGIVSRGGEGGALLGGALLHAQEHRLGAVAGLDPGPAQPNGDARSRDAELGGDRLHAAALLEESHDGFDGDLWSSHVLDSVVSTSRRAWSGFVYTLETERGSFAASGVVVHNCRCSLRAVRAKATKPKAVPARTQAAPTPAPQRPIDRVEAAPSTTRTRPVEVPQERITIEPETREVARRVLGRSVSDEALAALAGLRSARMVLDHDEGTVYLRGTQPMGQGAASASRQIYRDEAGRLTLYNEAFVIPGDAQGSGEGSRAFGQQVEAAAAIGVEQILAECARGRGMNGYYTWARLGYDAELPEWAQRETGLRTISELMATPEGRAWWKEHGQTFAGTFDPRPGSQSRRILDAYLRERFGKARAAEQAPDIDAEERRLDAAWDEVGRTRGIPPPLVALRGDVLATAWGYYLAGRYRDAPEAWLAGLRRRAERAGLVV